MSLSLLFLWKLRLSLEFLDFHPITIFIISILISAMKEFYQVDLKWQGINSSKLYAPVKPSSLLGQKYVQSLFQNNTELRSVVWKRETVCIGGLRAEQKHQRERIKSSPTMWTASNWSLFEKTGWGGGRKNKIEQYF